MGFLDKLRAVFSTEEKQIDESKNYSLEQLDLFFNEETAKAFDMVNEKFSEIRKNVSNEKESFVKNLEILGKAELKNTEIPERVKQVMEGNRETYIKRMRSLSNDISVPEEFSELVKFSEKFDKILGDFEKSIAKNHHVMLEFFVKEATAISTNVKNIDKLTKNIKKTLETNMITKLEYLKNKLSEVQKMIKWTEELKGNTILEKKKIDEDSNDISIKKYEIEKLKESEQFSEFILLTDNRQKLEKELTEIQSGVTHSFSEIGTALKKYSNLNKDNKQVKCYLDNPIKTLLDDKELNIVQILNSTKKEIDDKKIDLKVKKREKILKELNNLNEKYFNDFVNKNEGLNVKLEELNTNIKFSEIAKKVKELKNDLEQDEIKLLERKKTLSKMEKDLEEIDIDLLKNELESEILTSLGRKIKIV
jgi:hypothetical protein